MLVAWAAALAAAVAPAAGQQGTPDALLGLSALLPWRTPQEAARAAAFSAAAAPRPGSGPSLAPAWRAALSMRFGGVGLGEQRGTFLYDRPGQRWRATQCALNPIFHPTDRLCMDELAANVSKDAAMNWTIGEAGNSVCKVVPAPYGDLFATLAFAWHVGSGGVAGEPCELWELRSSVGNWSACIASDGVPRQFNQSLDIAYKLAGTQYYTFSNVSVGPHGQDAFMPSEVCRSHWPMPPCREGGAVVPLDLYRTHSRAEPVSLLNRNTGDALGAMAFFCDISGMDTSQLVTRWAVEANASWGQYAYCLYQFGKNVCFSGTGGQVGRESSLGLGKGPAAGQCSANEDVGSWFSTPADGVCLPGAAVGTGGCTWRARRVRTVSAACIVHDRGLQASCAQERGHAPMLRSAAILRAALDSADPARGGCPDVPISGNEPVAVVV